MEQRIALVSAFPPGQKSLNEYGLHLAKGLADRSDVDEVVVLADVLDQPASELDLGPKVRVDRVWRFNDPFSALRINNALIKHKVIGALWNLQTATFGDREIPAALGHFAPPLARALGFQSGVIAHNIIAGIDLESTQLRGQKMRQAIVRLGASLACRAMLAANYTTVTLQGYYEHIRQTYPNADIHLVPHGTFDTSSSDVIPLAGRPKRIVTMGKFGTYKRLDTLIEAFDLLRSERCYQDYELVIGGSDHPNAPGYLASLISQREQDSGIVFHGYVAEEDVSAFFGGARLCVFDYIATTGSSGVLHQAASYGVVPVFPRIGDFVDLCRDEGLAGEHFEASDAASLAAAMRRVLEDLTSAQRCADTNVNASQGMPFSGVIDFHAQRLLGHAGKAVTGWA